MSSRTSLSIKILALIGLVTIAFVLPSYIESHFSHQARARNVAIEGIHDNIQLLIEGLQNFHHDIGRYPTEKEGISELYNSGLPNWKGPYLQYEIVEDLFGIPYRYKLSSDGKIAEVRSSGPDKIFGDSDDIIGNTK